MRRATLAPALVLAVVGAAGLLLPSPVQAQIGLGARVGTLGIGGEAALALSDRAVLRGGIGLMPFEVSATFDDIEAELELPGSWYNLGLDLYLNGAMRIGGGFLFRPDDPRLTATPQTSVDIGGRTFTPQELGVLTGVLASKGRAPYLLIGFGKHTAPGFGLFLDVGAAFMGDPDVTLDAEGGTFSDQAELDARLAQEAENFEDDMRGYLRFWPIVSLGLRLGVR